MKTIFLHIPVFILLIMILSTSCAKQETSWSGTIEEVNGVTVVKNPNEPMYGEEVFIIEEELTIGESEGSEEYMFSEVPSLAVDDEN